MKITKLETFLVQPRWLFLKIHTDEGLVGLGEPILEGRAKTCAQAVDELAPYLIGEDPRRVVHHWQAMYRHAFYRGGPILTSALERRRAGTLGSRWENRSVFLSINSSADRHATASDSTKAAGIQKGSKSGLLKGLPLSKQVLQVDDPRVS